VAPPLVYCAGLVYGLEGRVPWAGPWLLVMALAAALLGVAVHVASPRGASGLFRARRSGAEGVR
jgi:hypothetical protein